MSEPNAEFSQWAFQYYPCLQKVKEYAEKQYKDTVHLEDVARIACMERKYFSVFFRKKVGVTFTFWMSQLRINAAMQLMRTANYSICEIAYAVGFEDLRTFQRAFRKHTNLTPREFKRSVCALPPTGRNAA